MIVALIAGARRAAGLWPLGVVLWLINGLFAALFAAAAGYWLGVALDGSLARRTLVNHLDADYLVDLYLHHGASFRMLLAGGAVLALAHVALWIWLHAVVVAAVRADPESGAPRLPWQAGFAEVGVFARLFALAGVVLLLFSAAIAGAAWLAIRSTAADTSAWLGESIIGGAACLWLGGIVILVAVHDHARIRVYAGGAKAWASYRWAWRFVLAGGAGALGVALALQLTSAAVWIAYQAAGLRIPVGEIIGVTGSLVWGELFLAVRTWMRLWFFSSQSELQG